MVGRALEVMREAGVRPEGVVAAIGPGISGECFEVGEEVAEAFVGAGWGRRWCRRGRGGGSRMWICRGRSGGNWSGRG